jgi:putative peptidoglycan lipid II flippase
MRFLSRQTKTVEKSAVLIGIFTLLSSLLGIFRNSLLASYLGASRNIDIYYASFRIPDFIFNIFIMGAITAGFIPLLSKYINTQQDEVNDFVNAIINFILITSLIFGVLLAIFATPVIGFLFKGLDVNSKLMIASMTRVMMLQPIILGFSAILGNILLVHDFVLSFALAPLLYNLGIILGVVLFYPRFGMMGLAYGVVLGAILNLIVKFIPMKLIDIKLGRISTIKMKKYFKEFSYLILPRTLSIINIQIFLFVVSYFVSFLAAGKLGIFNLANSFQDLPQTIFAVSIATAAFPVLSKMYHQNNIEGVSGLYVKSLYQINFTMLLVTVGFLVLKYPIVKMLLYYGNFSLTATQSVANILYIMTFGIIFSSLLLLNLNTLFS